MVAAKLKLKLKTMTTKKWIKQKENEILCKQKEISMLEKFPPDMELPSLDYQTYANRYDFNYPTQEQKSSIMRVLGLGKWSKELNSEDTLNYTASLGDGDEIRLWNTPPPPCCEIIEEDVLIPAQPARVGKKRRIKCPEPLESVE